MEHDDGNSVDSIEFHPLCFHVFPLSGGVSEKFIKASAISSATIEESHIQQWSKVMVRW